MPSANIWAANKAPTIALCAASRARHERSSTASAPAMPQSAQPRPNSKFTKPKAKGTL